MTPKRPAPAPPTCLAPDDEGRLCGRPATTSRIVDGIEIRLCSYHAAQLDEEAASMIEITLSRTDRDTIINALTDREHVSGGSGRFQHYRIAVWEDGRTASVWDSGAHFQPEPALCLSPYDLLDTDSGHSYTWGEDGAAAEEEAAREWIGDSIRSGEIEIELADGSTRAIVVRWAD